MYIKCGEYRDKEIPFFEFDGMNLSAFCLSPPLLSGNDKWIFSFTHVPFDDDKRKVLPPSSWVDDDFSAVEREFASFLSQVQLSPKYIEATARCDTDLSELRNGFATTLNYLRDTAHWVDIGPNCGDK